MLKPEDSEYNEENQNLSSDNDEYESDETTLEEFFDKVTVTEYKQPRPVVIIKPDNNSGMGEDAPESISHKFNWGAFLFNWIWGIKYNKYVLLFILLLIFIPYGFIPAFLMAIWAGMNGNQWAWSEVQYSNEEDFHFAQRAWVKWWFIIFGSILLVCSIIWLALPKAKRNEISIQSYSFFVSKELDIPQQVYSETDSKDKYADFLLSNKSIIYWVRIKNELTEGNKDYIEKNFKKEKKLLRDKYILSYDLLKPKEKVEDNAKTDVDVEDIDNNIEKDYSSLCINPDTLCMQAWLYKTCNNGYCIINPKTKKYYKIRGKENVIPKAIKLLKSWN